MDSRLRGNDEGLRNAGRFPFGGPRHCFIDCGRDQPGRMPDFSMNSRT